MYVRAQLRPWEHGVSCALLLTTQQTLKVVTAAESFYHPTYSETKARMLFIAVHWEAQEQLTLVIQITRSRYDLNVSTNWGSFLWMSFLYEHYY